MVVENNRIIFILRGNHHMNKRTTRVTLAGLLLLSLAACGQPQATSMTHDHSQSASRRAVTKLVPGVNRANFDRIQLAIEPDDYASTTQQVHALFGKPTKTTTITLNTYDEPLKTAVWDHGEKSLNGAVVSVAFHDNDVVAKYYRHAHTAANVKITTTTLDRLTLGTEYDRVTQEFGTPNSVSNIGAPHENLQMITYNHIKDHAGASVTFTFKQNQLSATSRTAI